MKIQQKLAHILKLTGLVAVFLCALTVRINYINEKGKDIDAYKRALTDLIEGRNPYAWTVESYSNPDDPGNHGFAYLPGLLYLYYPLFIIHLLTKVPFEILMKIPIILADIGIGLMLVKILGRQNYAVLITALLAWFFNPYAYLKRSFISSDPITIFLTLLALFYVEKDSVKSGTFYALAIATKTFPVILLPLFLLKVKDKKSFITSGALIALVISLPFFYDMKTYIRGALLVHGERYIQGRPLLFYLSYYYDIEFFQIIPFRVYTYLSIFSGWFVTTAIVIASKGKGRIAALIGNLNNKYVLTTVAFLLFYLFTPVLNRTYMIWFVPFLILDANSLIKGKKTYLYFATLLGFWSFYYWYLAQWKDGFHIWRP